MRRTVTPSCRTSMSGLWSSTPGSWLIACTSPALAASDAVRKYAHAPSPMTRQSSRPSDAWNCFGVIPSAMIASALDQPWAVALHDDPPEDPALAPVVVAVSAVHRRAVVDHQEVALAPGVVIDDLRVDHAVEQIGHVGPARLRRHPGDVCGLGDVEVHGARPMHGVGAHHRVLDQLAVLLPVLRARVDVPVQP